jgi:hypothetical protein
MGFKKIQNFVQNPKVLAKTDRKMQDYGKN